MKRLPRIISAALLIAVCLSLVPAPAAATSGWAEPGSSSLDILNGGTMVTSGEVFCYSDGGLYISDLSGGGVRCLTGDEGKNLNISGEWLYYTLGGSLKRILLSGGEPESLFYNGAEISQLYVLGEGRVCYISQGAAYRRDLQSGATERISGLSGIVGFVPTEYGNLYATGELFDYSIYAGDRLVLAGVTSWYTDLGYLVVNKDREDYMAEIAEIFAGVFELEYFHLHESISAVSLFSLGDEEHECSYCDELAKYQVVKLWQESETDVPYNETTTPEISQGQLNIVKRARQLHEIKWTPLADRYQWNYYGVFAAETTVSGLPYGQPVNNGGYVGWNISLEAFSAAVNDSSSQFYSTYSTYNKIAPAYSADCSSFTSYAWGLANRTTTYYYSTVAEMVSEQSIYAIQVGDVLNHQTSHIVLISDVGYNSDGTIVSIDILEQTPVKTKYTRYGEGGTKSLALLQSSYFGGGYVLYRKADRDNVVYTHNCAVPIDGDYCANCKATVPLTHTTSYIGGKSVTLSHTDASAVIYYTLDGSVPTAASTRYSGETLQFNKTTQLRAIAVSNGFSGSTPLSYTVSIPPVEKPKATITSGVSYNDLISSGSTVTLATGTTGATLYYTTDGSQPTASSTKYTAPITITQDMTIKVMGVAPGCTESEVSSFTYKIGTLYSISATAERGGSITPSGQSSVMQTASQTYTITASAGYAIADVKVDGVSVGAVGTYTFSDVSANHAITASFKVVSNHPFTDVSSDVWFHEAVSYAYRVSLFKGTSDTEFSPDTPMTRGMFVTVLGRMAGVDANLTSGTGIVTGSDVNIRSGPSTDTSSLGTLKKYTAVQILGTSGEWYQIKAGGVTGYMRGDFLKVYSNTFSDVASDKYYRPYIEWAYLSGIATGTSQTVFSPDTNISRVDMCTMIYNYVTRYGLSLGDFASLTTFNDDGSIDASAKTAVYALQRAGVIQGVGDNTFSPAGESTRAMVAQIYLNLSHAVS